MRWPHREDWSAHLVRWRDGHSSLEGPHGGVLDARGYERVACSTCGSVAVWPPNPPAAMYCFAPGHRPVRAWDDRIIGDTCPGVER